MKRTRGNSKLLIEPAGNRAELRLYGLASRGAFPLKPRSQRRGSFPTFTAEAVAGDTRQTALQGRLARIRTAHLFCGQFGLGFEAGGDETESHDEKADYDQSDSESTGDF